jgi:hypothetical protein
MGSQDQCNTLCLLNLRPAGRRGEENREKTGKTLLCSLVVN